jgi:hypothetical protein
MQRHANSHDSCPEDDYIPAPAHLSDLLFMTAPNSLKRCSVMWSPGCSAATAKN